MVSDRMAAVWYFIPSSVSRCSLRRSPAEAPTQHRLIAAQSVHWRSLNLMYLGLGSTRVRTAMRMGTWHKTDKDLRIVVAGLGSMRVRTAMRMGTWHKTESSAVVKGLFSIGHLAG